MSGLSVWFGLGLLLHEEGRKWGVWKLGRGSRPRASEGTFSLNMFPPQTESPPGEALLRLGQWPLHSWYCPGVANPQFGNLIQHPFILAHQDSINFGNTGKE